MGNARMSKLDIMNLMGNAAAQKASQVSGKNQAPNDEEDSLNSQNPKAKKPVQGMKSKPASASNSQGKDKGKFVGPGKAKM
jgi:hypothetical protein